MVIKTKLLHNRTTQKQNDVQLDTYHKLCTHMYTASLLLTHWGCVMQICMSKLTIIGSDNGLLPGWHQAIIWTNAGILLIRTLGTNFSEILGEIHTFPFKKMHLKMLSAKWRPFCLGLNVLTWSIMQRILYRLHSTAWWSHSEDLWKGPVYPFSAKDITTSFWHYNKWFWFLSNQTMGLYHFCYPIE